MLNVVICILLHILFVYYISYYLLLLLFGIHFFVCVMQYNYSFLCVYDDEEITSQIQFLEHVESNIETERTKDIVTILELTQKTVSSKERSAGQQFFILVFKKYSVRFSFWKSLRVILKKRDSRTSI